MSDPVTNVEIEDVLSSIRKLVSDQDRAQPARIDALVLTPDHRIEGADAPEDAPEDAADEARAEVDPVAVKTADVGDAREQDYWEQDHGSVDNGAQDHAEEDTAGPEMSSVYDPLEDTQVSLDAQTQDADVSKEAPARDTNPLSLMMDDAEPPVWPSELTDTPDRAGQADAAPDATADRMSSLERAIADLEQAVAQTDDAWEPDGVDENDNDPAQSSSEIVGWPSDVLDAASEDGQDVISFPSQRSPNAAGAQDTSAAELSEDVPQSEFEQSAPALMADVASDARSEDAAQERTNETDTVEKDFDANSVDDGAIEDGGEDGPAFVAPVPPFAPEADDEAIIAPQAGPENDPLADAFEDHLAAGDIAIDEDALRDIVSEIVREELQGELGERITRNVRKLVRREIQRALTSQNLI